MSTISYAMAKLCLTFVSLLLCRDLVSSACVSYESVVTESFDSIIGEFVGPRDLHSCGEQCFASGKCVAFYTAKRSGDCFLAESITHGWREFPLGGRTTVMTSLDLLRSSPHPCPAADFPYALARSRYRMEHERMTWPAAAQSCVCLLYTSPSPRDLSTSRMPSSA